jgi:hypothetical protein
MVYDMRNFGDLLGGSICIQGISSQLIGKEKVPFSLAANFRKDWKEKKKNITRNAGQRKAGFGDHIGFQSDKAMSTGKKTMLRSSLMGKRLPRHPFSHLSQHIYPRKQLKMCFHPFVSVEHLSSTSPRSPNGVVCQSMQLRKVGDSRHD